MNYKDALINFLKSAHEQVEEIQEKLDGVAHDLPYVPDLKINPYDLTDAISLTNRVAERLKNILNYVEVSE